MQKVTITIAALLCIITVSLSNIGCQKNITSTMLDTVVIPPIMQMPTPVLIAANKSYLALGDSYTIGQSVDSSERFPAQTAAFLKTQGINIIPLQYIATTGWTTTNLANAIATVHPKGPFDIVTLLIGVNDQYQNRNINDYGGRFKELLYSAIQLADYKPNHVFVLSIPDYGVTPFGGNNPTISQQIDAYNAINKQVTLEITGVNYLDITPLSRLASTDRTLIAIDGLHPSGKLYKLWANQLAPQIIAALK